MLRSNVLVAALISPCGVPAALIVALAASRFELIVSPALLAELDRVVRRPKFDRYATPKEKQEFLEAVRLLGHHADDPPAAEVGLTADPEDDYLIALARSSSADTIVSGVALSQPGEPLGQDRDHGRRASPLAFVLERSPAL